MILHIPPMGMKWIIGTFGRRKVERKGPFTFHLRIFAGKIYLLHITKEGENETP